MARNSPFAVGRLRFDARSGEFSAAGTLRRLEPKAAAVLAVLCEERGEVVARHALLDRCWGEESGSDEALTQAVAQIRRTLEEMGEAPDLVETLARRGYRLRAGSAPAPNDEGADERWPKRPRMKAAAMILVSLTVLLLAAAWIAFPHGSRHLIRHTLGLGPPAQGSSHAP